MIIGTGSFAPPRVVTNDDLAEIVDTSDEWIRSRTGIGQRRISHGPGTTWMAAEAAKLAGSLTPPNQFISLKACNSFIFLSILYFCIARYF